MRQIDAPEPTLIIPLHGLEDDAAGDSMRHAGLNRNLGPTMPHRAPDRTAQRHFRVAVPPIGVSPRPDSESRQPLVDLSQQLAKPLGFRTRPRRTKQLMQTLEPITVQLILAILDAAVPLPEFPRQRPPRANRINRQRPNQPHQFLPRRAIREGHASSVFAQPGSSRLLTWLSWRSAPHLLAN